MSRNSNYYKLIALFQANIFFSILLILVVLATNELYAATNNKNIYKDASFYLTKLATDFVLGDDSAPITIIEYSTLTCIHCSYFHQQVFDKIKQQYIDTGKVKWISRHFVTDSPSMKGAQLAMCQGKEKYYLYSKILFLKQSSWAYNNNYEEILKNIAKLDGMTEAKFHQCMSDKRLQDILVEQRMIAKDVLHVNGTPSFFINGEQLPAYNFEEFTKKINEILNAK